MPKKKEKSQAVSGEEKARISELVKYRDIHINSVTQDEFDEIVQDIRKQSLHDKGKTSDHLKGFCDKTFKKLQGKQSTISFFILFLTTF